MHPFDRRRMCAPRAELRTPPDPNRANRALYQVGLMHLYQVMALESEYRADPERASDMADDCSLRGWV